MQDMCKKYDGNIDIMKTFEIERPLLSAAIQWVTVLLRFIEEVPPFSATNLCKESSDWVGGKLTKSILSRKNQ